MSRGGAEGRPPFVIMLTCSSFIRRKPKRGRGRTVDVLVGRDTETWRSSGRKGMNHKKERRGSSEQKK